MSPHPEDYLIPLVKYPLEQKARISSGFGVREDVRNGKRHKGIDFAVPEGTPVYACFSGVALAKSDKDGNGAGKRVHLYNYSRGIKASYFHLSEFVLDLQMKEVQEGDILGWSGNTGHSTGPHLHFEITRLSDSELLHPYFTDDYTLPSVKEKAPYELSKTSEEA